MNEQVQQLCNLRWAVYFTKGKLKIEFAVEELNTNQGKGHDEIHEKWRLANMKVRMPLLVWVSNSLHFTG